ncbi:hypothetical protein [Bradyrhizobium sp. SZCCHNS3002]|uniref:hypothetical protein n=1 Tax=Bradyrhizobium sp. SZCCHNS3002 TaxID=3057310 RepID=UPI0028EC9168|nr:hypothetical protein [Bradyrhizobium sp. SZCCHNS3002]
MDDSEGTTRQWIDRFALLWALLIAVLSITTYAVGYFSTYGFLKDAGTVIAGGAVAALLFNALAQRSNALLIHQVIRRALDQVVSPIQAHVRRDALSDYKWYVRLERPSSCDTGSDYYVQIIRLSYTWPDIPRQIKVVGCVSNAGKALAPWSQDPEKGIVWKIETPGSPLNIDDPTVFAVGSLYLNGRSLSPFSNTRVEVKGGDARELIYAVPAEFEGTSARFEVEIRARMFEQPSGRMYTSSQFYRPAMNGEMIYVISDEIPVQEISPIVSEVTEVLPIQLVADEIWATSSRRNQARITFTGLIDRGSAVRFEWYKGHVGNP